MTLIDLCGIIIKTLTVHKRSNKSNKSKPLLKPQSRDFRLIYVVIGLVCYGFENAKRPR